MADVPFGKLFPKNGGGGGSVPGPQGPPGEDGADSTVPGPQGPAGEDSVVPGPPGTNGTDGTNGAAGPNNVTTTTDTDITGLLKGNGTHVAAAGAGTDYSAPGHAHAESDVTDLVADLAHPILPEPAALMLMDGTASIKDAITGTSFTMAGTPTTGALLGATAPDIGVGKYTSCTIPSAPIGQTAGMAFSMMFVVNTAWAGDDGVIHYLFDNQGTGAAQNRIYLRKYSSNRLGFSVCDNASALKQCYTDVLTSATWAANVVHIIVITRSAAGVMDASLGGTPFATLNSGEGTGLESAVGANSYFGTTSAAASPLTGLLLSAFWNRVLTAGEIAALKDATTWASIPAMVDVNKSVYWHGLTSSLMVLDTAWKKIALA